MFMISLGASAQDYLSVPSTNPSFFREEVKTKDHKIFYQVDSLVYEYDTLQLPFIDDFSVDHFPAIVKDPANDPRVIDTVFYALYINGSIYTGDEGFVQEKDTTFTFLVDTAGNTISKTPNPIQIIQYYDLYTYPPSFQLLNSYPPYDIVDTSGFGIDTIQKEPFYVQDSIKYYVVQKDNESFYLDRSVYRNYTMGFYPPSLGVVTFDGLNQFGLPYNFDDIATNGRADRLTSVPINLEGASDSTYFSFFFQAKGFALDGPNQEDSLSLEFYNSDTERWGLVWNQRGQSTTAPVDSFRQVMIRVDSQFRTSGFQFRFRNRARLQGAYDNWHVDYIYLDDGRSQNDTAQKDISYVYRAPSLLKEYEAMPVWHYRTNPANYMRDSVILEVRNNYSGPLIVFNKMVLPDTINNNNYYQFPPSNNFFRPIRAFGNLRLGYPLNFSYPQADIDSFQVFKGVCDIDFRPVAVETKDFIRENDTNLTRLKLTNYYAYDDGSAEAGYGVNTGSSGGNTSYLAVRFNMPHQDTLGGVQMYFLPQANDTRTQSFYLTVWSSLSPPNVIFRKEVRTRAIYDEKDAYITYWFDSLVLVGPTFYVGYEKVGQLSMNMGYDLNNNHRDKISWSLNGIEWFNPSSGIRDGSVMLRPILRKRNYGVGLLEQKGFVKREEKSLIPYPNPTNASFRLLDPPNGLQLLRLLSFDGRLLSEFDPRSLEYSIEGLAEGMYILQAVDQEGKSYTAKIMISNP